MFVFLSCLGAVFSSFARVEYLLHKITSTFPCLVGCTFLSLTIVTVLDMGHVYVAIVIRLAPTILISNFSTYDLTAVILKTRSLLMYVRTRVPRRNLIGGVDVQHCVMNAVADEKGEIIHI